MLWKVKQTTNKKKNTQGIRANFERVAKRAQAHKKG